MRLRILHRLIEGLGALSLAAPVVVVSYQVALSRWIEVSVGWKYSAFIFCGIWIGYIADRVSDTMKDESLCEHSVRHRFVGRNRLLLTLLAITALTFSAAAGILWLPPIDQLSGVFILGLAAVYISLYGNERADETDFWKKRLSASGLLALAGSWPFWTRPELYSVRFFSLVILFIVTAFAQMSLLNWPQAKERVPKPLWVLFAGIVLLAGIFAGVLPGLLLTVSIVSIMLARRLSISNAPGAGADFALAAGWIAAAIFVHS